MSEVRIRQVTPQDESFAAMVAELDAFLRITDGDENAFYAQYNGSDTLDHALLLELDGMPAAIGALRRKSAARVEVKRMYVPEHLRGHRLAAKLLAALEDLARREGYTEAVLETGIRQPAALRLYEREGYIRMAEKYAPYQAMTNSVCFMKQLKT